MHANTHKHPLPLPRLVVRLGGLGNRCFGTDNGVAGDPAAFAAQATKACQEVLMEIESALLNLHRDESPERARPSGGEPPSGAARGLGLLFGTMDRWGVKRRGGTTVRVFSEDKPLVSVLAGDAVGGDEIIRATALARPRENGGTVDYEYLPVTTEAPAAVPQGLGVGRPPAKDANIEAKLQGAFALTRDEARRRAVIARGRALAYRAQSEALRHHSDLLLAIWDAHAEGKAGGTSESVAAALDEGIPVLAIRITGEPVSLDSARPVVPGVEIFLLKTPRNLQALEGTGSDFPADDWRKELRGVLGYLLGFPDSPTHCGAGPHGPGHSGQALSPREIFAAFRENEPMRPLWPGRLWKLFNAVFQRRAAETELADEREAGERTWLDKEAAKAREVLREPWPRALFLSPPSSLPPAPIRKVNAPPDYAACYDRARARASSRGMSGIFGDGHRGGLVLSYALAALAVLLAVTGGILHSHHFPKGLQGTVAAAEFAAIALMYALAVCSRAEGWNAAYTDSRILAEALRMMEFLAPLGVHTPLPRLPYYLQRSEQAANPDRLWSVWYFRALLRMAPLRLGKPDLEKSRRQLQELANLEQRRYHRLNAARQGALHHWVETTVQNLFFLVGTAAALHFLDVAFGLDLPLMSPLGLALGVGGPAIIAALHGLGSQLETDRLRLRSSSLARLLEERSRALAALDLSEPDAPAAVWGLATEALATATLLMDETAGWSMLYRNANIHAG